MYGTHFWNEIPNKYVPRNYSVVKLQTPLVFEGENFQNIIICLTKKESTEHTSFWNKYLNKSAPRGYTVIIIR